MNINGINAFVTGGASGLGEAVTKRLLESGAKSITIADLPTSDGISTAKRLGEEVQFVPVDIRDTDTMTAALDLAEQNGPIHVLVHCAGRGGDRLRILGKDGKASPLDSF